MLAVPEGGSLLDASRPLPTDGLIQLSDVFGQVDGPRPIDDLDETVRGREPGLDDVDAAIEAVVGNSGRFPSAEFRVDAWPDAMTYLATHIVEVRDHQIDRLQEDLDRLGYDSGAVIDEGLVEELRARDAKIAGRAESVGQSVVEVVQNHAPRTNKVAGQNGSAFYAGVTENGVIFYTQAPYLRDLRRDGRIIELHRVLNESNGGLWPDGHQFRSAEVANTRSIPESRKLLYSYVDEASFKEAVANGTHDYEVPEQGSPLRVVWADKFGNLVFRLRDPEEYNGLIVPGNELKLAVEGWTSIVQVAESLDDAETGHATIFKNPRTDNPRYVDFAIKSNDCLGTSWNGLNYIREAASRNYGQLTLRNIRELHIDLGASRS